MSQYYGDIQLGDTIQWTFTTVDSAGAPTILTGSPTATAYTDGGVTQSATGVTLTADFDGVTGLNLMSVVATSGNGFAAGENIEIVLDAGTVGGGTVVGYAIGSFSVENRSNLRPTTVGNNEVDVTATGAVGIDWNNIENPTTAQNLSATNIDVDQIIASVSGNVDGSVNSVATAITLPTIPANWITAAGINASALDDKGNWNINKTGYALTTADWNVGKTGYTLSQSFPTNFASLAITAGGVADADVTAINSSTSAAAQLALSAVEIENGAAEGTPSTTVIQTDLAEAQNDIYIGRIVIFTSGNARGEATEITDYDGSSGTLTVTALANAPAAADTFILL